MFTATVIVSTILALIATGTAVGKLTKQAVVVESLASVGIPVTVLPPLASVELAGAFGLIVGLWIPALGGASGF